MGAELDDAPGTFLLQRYGVDEARRAATEGPTSEMAAEALHDWFTDRLTVDPGVPGPFGGLAFDLIGNALDLVDWESIADEVRAAG